MDDEVPDRQGNRAPKRPWTGMPMLVAPIAGALSDRIGGRPLPAAGLLLQAIVLGWLALVVSPTVPL